MSTVPSMTEGMPLKLSDVTVRELDFPRSDMAALDPATRELFVSRGLTTADCARLLERAQLPVAVCKDCPEVFETIDQREAHLRLPHDRSPVRRSHTVQSVRRTAS